MRTFVGFVVVALLVCAGCGVGLDPSAAPTPPATTTSAPAPAASVSLASLGLDWPRADGTLDAGDPPAAPPGFDADTLARMASILTDWAGAAALDGEVWHSAKPLDLIADALPAKVAATLRAQTKGVVSPRLAVANVFASTVTVGAPLVTTAWKVRTAKDAAGTSFMVLELQTRTAYEVRLGAGGPTRVIGMLRVQGLSAYVDTVDDFGVTGGWQEFGASDCALALDDDLVPDNDPEIAAKDLARFITVGDGAALMMPPLTSDQKVDEDYLKRCRDGSV